MDQQEKLIKRATTAAIGIAAVLILAKAYAWHITHSIGVQASLLDSCLDVFASIINFFAVRKALKPADYHHRFGYGKVEALAGLGQTLFIMVSGLWLIGDIYDRALHPQNIANIDVATGVMAFSIILTLLLVMYQRYVVSRTKSIAIEADSLHYQTDLFANIGVLIAVNVSVYLNVNWLDPLVGTGIVVYLIITSWKIMKISLDILVDKELPENLRLKIINLVTSHEKVAGVHDLKTRSAGLYEFIQMHLDLDERLTLGEAHDIAEDVELKILEIFPKAEVIIHQDPVIITGQGFDRSHSRIDSWIKHKKEWCGDYEHTQFEKS